MVQSFGVEVAVPNADTVGDDSLGPYCSAYTCDQDEFRTVGEMNGRIVRANGQTYNYFLSVLRSQDTIFAGKSSSVNELFGSFPTDIDPEAGKVYGKQVVALIENKRIFSLTCVGPVSRKAETDSLYKSLTESVQFFAPVRKPGPK